MKKVELILVACMLACIGVSAERVATLYPVDAMVRGDSPETRYGDSTLMMLRHWDSCRGISGNLYAGRAK